MMIVTRNRKVSRFEIKLWLKLRFKSVCLRDD